MNYRSLFEYYNYLIDRNMLGGWHTRDSGLLLNEPKSGGECQRGVVFRE